MRVLRFIIPALLAGACAGPGKLVPGQAGVADVERTMGPPAFEWRDDRGWRRLLYPTGPMGYHTWMASIEPGGSLARMENVLDENHFAAIRPGMTKEQVMQALGPPYAPWTMYFKARDELAWEWRYCDLWRAASRFNVLFDNTRGTVRSTLSIREVCGRDENCLC